MADICKCCGQPVPDRLGITVDGGAVTFGGKTALLTTTEMRVFNAFRSRPGRVVSQDMIFSDMYFDRPDCDWPDADKQVAVYIHKVRNKIKPLGLRVANVFGYGWRLEAAHG